MNEKINFFLETEDLDSLHSAKGKLRNLNDNDIILIRSILKEWEPPQAVANLLFYPSIIPVDMRIEAILEGLADKHDPYIALAATVGLQDLDPQQMPEEEREYAVKRLLEIIASNENVLAERASASILPFLNKNETKKVFSLLSNPSEIVRQNLLGWLYKTVAPESRAEFMEKARKENVSLKTREKIANILEKNEQMETSGLPNILSSPLYSYIPNRKEMNELTCKT